MSQTNSSSSPSVTTLKFLAAWTISPHSGWGKELQRGGDILEGHAHVGSRMLAGARPNAAIPELDGATDALIHGPIHATRLRSLRRSR